MNTRRAVTIWGTIFALALVIGAGSVMATHRWGCWKYADANIYWYNGGGSYASYYEQEAKTDSNSWHNYTDVNLTNVGSAGSTDHINAYTGYYGANGWLGLASIIGYSGCTVRNGRAQLNQSYLGNGSYSATNIKHVACQEVAHLFGLAHNRGSSTTCMNDTILTAPQPNSHDQSLVNSIY